MPTVKLAALPESPSRLCQVDHKETLAILDPNIGEHVIRSNTYVFERKSLFWVPADWLTVPAKKLAGLVDGLVQDIYDQNRIWGLKAGQESGDYNYQALLSASGRFLDLAEFAKKPWQDIDFRCYALIDQRPKYVSREEFERLVA